MAHGACASAVSRADSIEKPAPRGKRNAAARQPRAVPRRFATMRAGRHRPERNGRHANPYDRDLDRNAANYAPLTPLSFIARTAYI